MNISIPNHGRKKYEFDKLPIGGSVFFETDRKHRIPAAASAYGKKTSKIFQTRMVREDNKKGIRVWRIS